MKKHKKEGQWLSAIEVIQLIAKEQAKRKIAALPFKEYRDNLEEVEKEEVKKNLQVLQPYIEDDSDLIFYTPFINEYTEVILPVRVAFLVDIVDEYDLPIKLLCNEATEGFILSLKPEQREHCYVINNHKIQGFEIKDNTVVFEDILTVDEKQRDYKKRKRDGVNQGKEELKRRLAVIEETLGYMQAEYEAIERELEKMK